nr:hypothetical protein [Ardenticatena sp.]
MTTQTNRLSLTISQFVTLLLLTILLLSLANFGLRAVERYRLRHRADVLQAAIAAEREEYARLLARKAYVASPEYQARLAHELGLYAPNERRLIVLDGESLRNTTVEEERVVVREADMPVQPYWQQWWEAFFGPLDENAAP